MIIQTASRISDTQEYYFATKLREIRQRQADGQDIISLAIGSPDLPPSQPVIDRLIQSATQAEVHAYQPYRGIPALREAFARFYRGAYDVSLDPESEILPLIGSKEGIMHISMAFLNPGDEGLIPNPGYPTYAAVARLVGAHIRTYDLEAGSGWQPNLEALAQTDLSKVKLMWINYPHMPTGTRADDALIQALIGFARQHRILLCHDNPYSLILNPEPKSIFAYPGAKEVALELNSLSKSHNMAGWRIGMLSGAQPYIDAVVRVKSNMDSGMFRPLQEAAALALDQSAAWYETLNNTYRERREWIWRMMDRLDCEYDPDQAGLFVWARIPDQATGATDFSEHILNQAHVFIAPGVIFGSQGERYIRASLCAPTERIQEATQRILSLKNQVIV